MKKHLPDILQFLNPHSVSFTQGNLNVVSYFKTANIIHSQSDKVLPCCPPLPSACLCTSNDTWKDTPKCVPWIPFLGSGISGFSLLKKFSSLYFLFYYLHLWAYNMFTKSYHSKKNHLFFGH